jgi:hypothetical protein
LLDGLPLHRWLAVDGRAHPRLQKHGFRLRIRVDRIRDRPLWVSSTACSGDTRPPPLALCECMASARYDGDDAPVKAPAIDCHAANNAARQLSLEHEAN